MSSSFLTSFPNLLLEEEIYRSTSPIFSQKEIENIKASIEKYSAEDIIGFFKQDKISKETIARKKSKGWDFLVYNLFLKAIEINNKKPNKKFIRDLVDTLVANRHFKYLDPQTAFLICIECIRKNQKDLFYSFIQNIKFKNPLHPELCKYKTDGGETLTHLACKIDKGAFINCIATIQKNFLEIPNNKGETCAHYASKYNSIDCLKELIKMSPRIFIIRDNSGKTPLDENNGNNGGILCKKVVQKKIDNDYQLGQFKKWAAVKKIMGYKEISL